jgi:hypothetical protein
MLTQTLIQNWKRENGSLTQNLVSPSLPQKSKEELEEPEEGECLFHSQMWVKGTPLHFIVDSGSQKNLISVEVVKRLNLTMTPHPQPYTIGWLSQG